jgi:hypothetical protein
MTYKERLEQLLLDSVQKSEKYIAPDRLGIDALPLGSDQDPAYLEWESAENAYTDFLDFIKMNQINPGDAMTGDP